MRMTISTMKRTGVNYLVVSSLWLFVSCNETKFRPSPITNNSRGVQNDQTTPTAEQTTNSSTIVTQSDVTPVLVPSAAPSPSPEPTQSPPSPTPQPTPPPPCVPGQWTNPVERMDTDRSRNVNPLDGLAILDDVNTGKGGPIGSTYTSPYLLDVNSDCVVDLADYQIILDFLNRR